MEVFALKEHFDVLVVEVGIGNMPPTVATEYVNNLKNTIKEVFPRNKVLVIPVKDYKSININIVQVS